MARIGDVVLLEKPADDKPKRIDCYQIVDHSASSAAFKIDPARLIYAMQWKHNAYPPDYELVLIQDEPPGWVDVANLVLLGELRRRAPEAIDWTELTAAGVVPSWTPSRPHGKPTRAGIDMPAAPEGARRWRGRIAESTTSASRHAGRQ